MNIHEHMRVMCPVPLWAWLSGNEAPRSDGMGSKCCQIVFLRLHQSLSSPMCDSHFQCIGVLACIFHCVHFSLHAPTAPRWNAPDSGLCCLLHRVLHTFQAPCVSQLLYDIAVLLENPVLSSFTGGVCALMVLFASLWNTYRRLSEDEMIQSQFWTSRFSTPKLGEAFSGLWF